MALIGGANGASRSRVTQSMKMSHLNAKQHPPMGTGHTIPSNHPHMATGTLDGKVGTTANREICPGHILPETPPGTNFSLEATLAMTKCMRSHWIFLCMSLQMRHRSYQMF